MEKQNEDLKAIREMMEKSTKFLSLSGMSGVMAGAVALLGVAYAHFVMPGYEDSKQVILLGLVILALALAFGTYFSWQKSRKLNQKFFTKLAVRMLFYLAVPLIAGALFSLYFLFNANILMALASTLIFYGLALLNVSKYTYPEIQYLGLVEVGLGIVTVIFPLYAFILWAVGFGVCHIGYGIFMYFKYDKKRK